MLCRCHSRSFPSIGSVAHLELPVVCAAPLSSADCSPHRSQCESGGFRIGRERSSLAVHVLSADTAPSIRSCSLDGPSPPPALACTKATPRTRARCAFAASSCAEHGVLYSVAGFSGLQFLELHFLRHEFPLLPRLLDRCPVGPSRCASFCLAPSLAREWTLSARTFIIS